MKKKAIAALAAFALAAASGGIQAAFAQNAPMDAAAVVSRSRERTAADTVSARYRMVLSAKNGNLSERVMDQYTKKDSDGNNRTVAVFQEPASIRGTRFLTLESPGKNDDQWIFLPSFGQARRIVASDSSGSFMGTDFSYDDIASMERKPEHDDHRTLREERSGGLDCYVIESTPRDPGYQYSRMIQWIDKEAFAVRKIELYDKRGTRIKLLEMLEYREVQGRLSPIVAKMTTLADGTSTTLNAVNLKYDDPIPEGVFTVRFLTTGRPR